MRKNRWKARVHRRRDVTSTSKRKRRRSCVNTLSPPVALLEDLGFEGTDVPGIIGTGEAMRQDLQKRDPSGSWRTMIGAAQFAAAKRNTVVQARTPHDAMVAVAQQADLGQYPIVQTALAGLEQSVGDSEVVQAVVISPVFGMAAFDPPPFCCRPPDWRKLRRKLKTTWPS